MTIRCDIRDIQTPSSQSPFFFKFGRNCAEVMGHPLAFTLAIVPPLAWAATEPIFKFSECWQQAINTGTTVIIFLLVFLIQNSQSRNTEAMQLKLAELTRATQPAQNASLKIKLLSEKESDRKHAELFGRDIIKGKSILVNSVIKYQT